MRIRMRLLIPLLLAVGFLLVSFAAAQAQDESPGSKAIIYFFWGDGCPHCAEAKPVLEALAASDENIELKKFEVYYDEINRVRFQEMAAQFGFEASAVPTIFVGEAYWVGYTEQIGEQIKSVVNDCLVSGCPDAATGVIAAADPSPAETSPEAPVKDGSQLTLPLIGTVNLENQSLAISTALIAFVDGFNPCSLWVLSMLMALVLHTGSRRKIFIVGIVFLTITALVYVLFIAGLFSVLSFISYLGWVQVVVALVALVFAIINIKDYFWYKEGVSMTISDDKKPGLFEKMRRVLDASDSLWGLVSATVVLAAGVSLVEFSCTAGFPVLWTNLLTAQGVSASTFVLLLILYMVIYQIDELAIFLTVVFTLRTSRFEEKHGRILKLVGGMLMLTLAVVMLIDPALMNNLITSLVIFGAAFAVAGIVLLLHRKILPSYGIWIGTREGEGRKRKRHKSSS